MSPPAWLDWDLFRVMTSGKWAISSRAQMESEWSLEDLHDALDALEFLDELAIKAANPPKKQAPKP